MDRDPLGEHSGRSRFERGLDVVSLNVCRTPQFRSVEEHRWSWEREGVGK